MFKSKNIKSILFIILSYISVLLFQNLSSLIRKIMFSSSVNFSFINETIIISLLIISFIIIFRNKLFKNKAYLWIILSFLFACNFAQGYFPGFNAFTFIVLYLYLLVMTFCTILKTKNGFELSIVYSFSALILSAFTVGLFGLLSIFKYILLIFAILMIFYIYKKSKGDHTCIEESLNKLFSSGFVIFNILWVLAIFFGAGLYVHSYDEYSHWAYDAKAMIYYSKFGTSQKIMLKTRAYAPIFTVWHYIVSIFSGFSEHNLYVGLNMLISIYLLPIFFYINKNNFAIKILVLASTIFCCYIFGGVYSYTTLYVDYAITAIFASTLIIYFISKDMKTNLNKIILFLVIILTLSKPNGFVISFVFLLMVFLDNIIDNKVCSIKDFLKKCLLVLNRYKFIILTIIITFITWKFYLFITNKMTIDYYNFNLVPTGLKSDLKYKLNYDFIRNFLQKVKNSFDVKYINGIIPISLYQYLLITFGLLYLNFYKTTKNIKVSFKKMLPILISYFAFFCLTVLSIFVAMSLHEASNLASFGRYLNWYNLALLLFNIFLLTKTNDDDSFCFKIIVLILIMLYIPFSTLISFINNSVKNESYNLSQERTKKVELINNNTPQNSLIYVIDQKDTDGIMAMWYSRYYVFPRKTNASASAINWKIRTEKNKEDLRDWGLNAKRFANNLKEYKFDYLFLYSVDEDFFEETKFMYNNYDKAKKASLFKIEISNDTVKLIPIK